jgi:hypothetical protein
VSIDAVRCGEDVRVVIAVVTLAARCVDRNVCGYVVAVGNFAGKVHDKPVSFGLWKFFRKRHGEFTRYLRVRTLVL